MTELTYLINPLLTQGPAEDVTENITTRIEITSITGGSITSTDLTRVTVGKNTPLIIEGTISGDDREAIMAFSDSSGSLKLFTSTIVDNNFTAEVVFSESGRYTFGTDESNYDLEIPLFNVTTLNIDVLEA